MKDMKRYEKIINILRRRERGLQGLRGKESLYGRHRWTRSASRQATKREVPRGQRTWGRGRPGKRFGVEPRAQSWGKRKPVACSKRKEERKEGSGKEDTPSRKHGAGQWEERAAGQTARVGPGQRCRPLGAVGIILQVRGSLRRLLIREQNRKLGRERNDGFKA